MAYFERSLSGGGPFSPLLHQQNDKGGRGPKVLVQNNYLADDPNTHAFQMGLVNTNYLCGHYRAETADKQLGQGDSGGGNLG